MKKKCLAILLALCVAVPGVVIFPIGPETVKADEEEGDIYYRDESGDGWWYSDLGNNKIEITSYLGPENQEEGFVETEVTIPSTIDGKTVVRIGDSAFNGVSSGFVNEYVVKVTIPEGVTSIGYSAFRGCEHLAEIIIPNSVTQIEKNAFEDCAIAEITIPKSVTSIGTHAFYLCENLTTINVDENNGSYASQNGILYNKEKTTLVSYVEGKDGEFTVPDSVTSIGDYAFYHCTGLTGITFTENVESIGNTAFGTCNGLEQVTVPGTVKSIG
ncbi:MAG: leucine-rich repeat domain-containing protein, partial [Lachnospiraceae bacterium]